MKTIEIVLATNGENLFWADGLQPIITEYSTRRQKEFQSEKHSKLNYQFRHNRNNFGSSFSMENFIQDLQERISYAREIYIDLATTLNFDSEKMKSKSFILTGHKIVHIENDPNICEANQFLTHIIKNYDSLAENTFFLQGFPHDHCKNIMPEIIKATGKDFQTLPSSKKRILSEDGHDLLARNFGKIIMKKDINSSEWSAGACFMASKKAITKNKVSWYEFVLDEARKFKNSKFAVERLWSVIINPELNWS